MIAENELKRMELSKYSNDNERNCIGTVLYVLGIIDKDEYVGTGENRWRKGIVNDFLEQLVKIESPEKNSLLVIRGVQYNKRIEHMGIVVNDNPVIIFHRPGYGYEVKTQKLEEILDLYEPYSSVEFYIKRK